MNRIYRVIWNCTLQVFQACSELTRRAGKTSTVNLRKSSGLTTKFSRLTLGFLLALSGSASGASLEVDNDQITNIDTDVAYDAYLVGWYGTGVLNILAGGNASLTTITTSVIGANEDSEGTVNVLGGTWRLYDSGNNARPLNVGQSGTGTLNIKQKGHVDGGYLRLGSSTGGVGTVNVEGEDSVLTTELFEIGSYGTGSLNITDKGYVTSSIVAILGYQAGSNGQVVVEKGGEWLIKNNDSSIEFQIGNQGTGEATIREGGLITAENTINQRVGELTKLANGAHTFKYAPEWLASRYARPLSLSLPLQRGNITSDAVFNFFDNLLPDSPIVRDRIVKRYHAKSRQPFDLLSEIGRDSVGAVTLLPENETITRPIMAWEKLTEARLEDRYDFMKFQVFQWLIGATDGHAKNFSVFIQAGGSYRLTPFYDIISAFPVLGGTGIHISDLKLAMGLNASKGKKTAIDKIYPRHFLATAKVLRFPEVQMHEILSDFARMIPAALDNVKTSLPTDFPENVVTAVETNVLRLHGRLSREYGSK